MTEELEVQNPAEEHRLEVANFPITRTGDLIGTIGFGGLIALGGVRCMYHLLKSRSEKRSSGSTKSPFES